MFYPTKTEYNVKMWKDKNKTEQIGFTSDAKDVYLNDGTTVEELLVEDITTPIVTHDTTSFKVGVGDSDISKSVVDGEIPKMTIKGQSYQNILPEPSLRNNMDDGKSVQKFNEGYEDINVVDGVGKNMILKGKTLVDLKGKIITSKTKVLENTGYTIKAEMNGMPVDDTWSNINVNLKFVKPNTNYFVRWDKIEGLFSNGYLTAYQRVGNIALDNDLGLPRVSNKDYTSSSFIVFNSGDTTDPLSIDIRFHLNGTGTHSGEALFINITGLQVVEYQTGMENWEWKYFDGMASVQAPTIASVGKNLFNGQFELGSVSVDTGSEVDFAGAVRTSYIKVKPNTNYCISRDIQTTVGVRVYDTNKKFLKSISLSSNDATMFTTPNRAGYIRFALIYASNNTAVQAQLEESSIVTSHETHKSNTLSLPEEIVLRSLPNGVCDTYNVVTKEYVQRIETLVLKGGFNKTVDFATETHDTFSKPITGVVGGSNFYCDKFVVGSPYETSAVESIVINSKGNQIAIRLALSRLTSYGGLINPYVEANPITIQYELATPVVKTVDLSSIGNWEKVVLNGTQTLSQYNDTGKRYYGINISNITPYSNGGRAFANKLLSPNSNMGSNTYSISPANSLNILCFSLDGELSKAEATQYLSQNPITVWYQTATSQANSIKEMLSFANGHIQLSSGVENSLTPSVVYEVPTSNSYHMDLMKAGTWTVKSKSCNGVMYVGSKDLHFGLTSTNRTIAFTQAQIDLMPTNLWWFDKTFVDGMVLEGDVTTKTFQYFKGIKSSFGDCYEIEIATTGKNLFDGEVELGRLNPSDGSEVITNLCLRSKNFIKIPTNTSLAISNDGGYVYVFYLYDKNKNFISEVSTLSNIPSIAQYMKFRTSINKEQNDLSVKHWVYDYTDSSVLYEPYKSSITKIPLAHPLRKLPDGVHDEIVINRMNNKATIIQRVGAITLVGSENWSVFPTMEGEDTLLFQISTDIVNGKNSTCISDKFPNNSAVWSPKTNIEGIMIGGGGVSINKRIDLRIAKTKVSSNSPNILRSYLRDNPITVLYELASPIITDVDIEGFPYIYQDGHIMISSTDIKPTIEIGYNVNQSQQIKSSNETLMRHEKDIMQLDELISLYINELYISVAQGLDKGIIAYDYKTRQQRAD